MWFCVKKNPSLDASSCVNDSRIDSPSQKTFGQVDCGKGRGNWGTFPINWIQVENDCSNSVNVGPFDADSTPLVRVI